MFQPVAPEEGDLTPLPGVRGEARPSTGGVGVSWLALLLLVAFHVAVNLVWLYNDNHAIRTDEEGHMQIARAYHETLFLTHHDNLVKKLIAVADIRPGNPAHPPLLSVLGAFMIQAFGYHPDTIAATCTILFALLILGVFFLARQILPPWQAFFAAFVVSFTPVVYGSSRFFMTDFLTATLTVWALYVLLKSQWYRHTGWIFAFALLNGLAIMARTNSFIYYLVPALFIAVGGAWRALVAESESGQRLRVFGTVLLNGVVTVVVTLGICLPWYFHHLDVFYDYWTETHQTHGPLALDLAPAPAPAEAPVVARAQAVPTETPGWLSATVGRFENPPVPWTRYAVHLINNGVFLPTFVLGALGLLCALFHRRFRGLGGFTIVLWALGGWVLLTLLFKHSTPRYVLPFAGGMAFCAALAVLAPPWRWSRGVLMAALAALLVVQFVNLSVRAYPACARMEIPGSFDEHQQRYGDDGLVLWKDVLILGDSYGRISAPVNDNYKDLLLGAMVAEELRLKPMGEYANYLRLRVRGMEFDERHYWRGDAYAWPGWKPEQFPGRKLRSIGWADTIEGILPRLNQADYVVYYLEADREDLEAAWREGLTARGLHPVARFKMPRSGSVEPRIYGVYAQATPSMEVTRESIDALADFDLYTMVYRWDQFPKLPPALQEHAKARFQALIDGKQPYRLCDEVSVIPLNVTKPEAGVFEFHALFQVHQKLDRDFDILFQGLVDKNDVDKLPPDKRAQGYMDWAFTPKPATSTWEPGGYVWISHRITPGDMTYQIQFCLVSPSGQPRGRAANLGWVDFSKL